MDLFYGDLHVHLGAAGGRKPVKITAAASLTLPNILREAAGRKGLHMVGVVDAQTRGALEELRGLVNTGELLSQADGGLRYHGRLTLIPAAELEVRPPAGADPGHPAHFIVYLPTLEALEGLAHALAARVKNPYLSSQACGLEPAGLVDLAAALEGFVVPAHVFTPFKGAYGAMARRLAPLMPPATWDRMPAVELGLSADTGMADRISELHAKAFLSNSDAHSLAKIAREYNAFELAAPTFRELHDALLGRRGRRVATNYGLDPLLGKYHRATCAGCGAPAPEAGAGKTGQIGRCSACGGRLVQGVAARLEAIADLPPGVHPPDRPPYRPQVPLEFIPGLGPRALERLLTIFGSEMAVLHRARPDELARVVGPRLAERVVAAREGRLQIQVGGGGRYGRVAAEVPAPS